MSINPDIEETRLYHKLADEMIAHCELEEVTYVEGAHYDLLYVFSRASSTRNDKQMRKDFPCMTDALAALDNRVRVFDWPSLATVIDQKRGKSMIKFETT